MKAPIFKRKYLVTIEGVQGFDPCGWGDKSHESRHLEQELGKAFWTAVSEFYQTQLSAPTCTIYPINPACYERGEK